MSSGRTVRKRARGPKVKTGCITCKIRHVKCDEEKPSCLKCRSTGRTCDGYLTQDGYQSSVFRKEQVTSAGTLTIARTPYVGVIGDDQERRGFKFFQFQTAQELTTALHLTSLNQFMLQASHSNPAVLHAAVALGSLGERFQINSVLTTENSQANNRHDFACRQYYKAVKQLREQLCNDKERSVDFVLISCFLFTCFEFLQGNDAGALMHLRSGLEILRRNQAGPTADGSGVLSPVLCDSGVIIDDIFFVFCVLDVQATIWLGLESFQSPAMNPVGLPDTTPQIPECFSSLEKAKQSLDCQITATYLFLRLAAVYLISQSSDEPPKMTIAERQNRLTQLGEWLLALEAFVQLGHELSAEDLRCITVMNMNYKITFMVLTVSFQPDEEATYRSFHTDFAEIISLAEALLRPASSDASRLRAQVAAPIFNFEALLIQPLYFTAVKCRHLPTCQKAISLLSTSPWREGAWDSAAMARIAERKVRRWEEEGVRYGCHDTSDRFGALSLFAGEGVIVSTAATASGGLAPFLPTYGNSTVAEQTFHQEPWHGGGRTGSSNKGNPNLGKRRPQAVTL